MLDHLISIRQTSTVEDKFPKKKMDVFQAILVSKVPGAYTQRNKNTKLSSNSSWVSNGEKPGSVTPPKTN